MLQLNVRTTIPTIIRIYRIAFRIAILKILSSWPIVVQTFTTRLVLQATNTEQVFLSVEAVAGVLSAVVYAPAVGVEATVLVGMATVLAGTPPVTVVAHTLAETAMGIAEAARQGGKVMGVLA